MKPAKTPQQTRSIATVDAILQATIQVLHTHGKQRLTTTRIAQRAGVSVGTLYQYFPNKLSLLQEALRRHMDMLADALERACDEAHGQPLEAVADAIADAWIATKLSTVKASVALYAVVDDIEGRSIANERTARIVCAMAATFRAAPGKAMPAPELVARTLIGALSGVSRDMLDPAASPAQRVAIATQLRIVVRAYVVAHAAPGRSARDRSAAPTR